MSKHTKDELEVMYKYPLNTGQFIYAERELLKIQKVEQDKPVSRDND